MKTIEQPDLLEQCARTAHEVNRAYCEGIGDVSQLPWSDAPLWQRDSALLGVRFLVTTPNATERAQHDSWVEQRLADGWQYGPEKDPEKKRHPCIVPYEELPQTQRAKDTLFGATVRGVLAQHGHWPPKA